MKNQHNNLKAMVICSLLATLPSFSMRVLAEPRAEDHAMFAQLFGKKIENVKKTRETNDDLDLVQEMQDAAASIPDSPEVQRLIYRSMIDLATESHRTVLAIQAIDKLGNQFPSDPAASLENALSIIEEGYRTSRREERREIGELYIARLMEYASQLEQADLLDDASRTYRRARIIARDVNSDHFSTLQDLIDRIDRHIQTQSKIQTLKNQLDLNQSDTAAAQELTTLLMVNNNAPNEALMYVEKSKNSQLIEIVELAAKDSASLSAQDAFKLAQWYDSQSKLTDINDLIQVLLENTIKHCDLALQQYTSKDALRLRMSELRDGASERLAAIPSTDHANITDKQWIDLIKSFNEQKHSLGEQIKKEDGQLLTSNTDFILDVNPKSKYELNMEFLFVNGEDGLNFSLPLANKHFSLTYSRFNHTRIELLGVKEITDPKLMLKPGKKIQLSISVNTLDSNTSTVVLSINGTTIIEWKGNPADLQSHPVKKTPEAFGQSIRVSCGGDFKFTAIKFKTNASE